MPIKTKADAQAEKARRLARMKEERLAYRTAKAKVYGLEERNFSKIIILQSGDWYKIGGHSLIFYMNFVAKRQKLKVEPRPDTDFHSVFMDGVWSFKELEQFEKRLETEKIFPERQEGLCRYYKLGHTVSPEEMQALARAEELRRSKLNAVVMPEQSYPDLYTHLRYIAKTVTEKLRKVDAATRAVMGVEASRRVIDLEQKYVLMTNGSLEKGIFFKECLAEVEWLLAWLLIMEDLRVIELKACLQLGEDLVAVKKMAAEAVKETEAAPASDLAKKAAPAGAN